MANYDATTTAAQLAATYKSYEGNLAPTARKKVFSMADLTALKGSAPVATDTFDLLPIFPGDLVVGTYTRVVTADGAASTLALGDQSAASFQAATALNSAAGTVASGNGAYIQSQTPGLITGGKYYAAANTLRGTLAGTIGTTGVFEVVMMVLPMGTLATV
jgi:hypothetical protein